MAQVQPASQQPYHPAAQKTRLLLEEVLVRPAGGAHPVVCVGPNSPIIVTGTLYILYNTLYNSTVTRLVI